MFGKRQFLINAEGKSCLIFPDARRKIVEGMPSSTDAMLEIAIHEEGWVAVEVDPDTRQISLKLDAGTVNDKALDGAGQMLLTYADSDIKVDCFDNDWRTQNFSGGAQGAAGLLTIFYDSIDRLGRQRFSVSNVQPNDQSGELPYQCQPLLNLMELWRDKSFQFDQSIVPFLKSLGLFDRSVLVEPSEHALGGIFLLNGQGFTLFGSDWPNKSIGRPITDQPDPVYGRWVGKSYEQIFRDRKPQVLQVDASVRSYPTDTPRRSYVCIRLPWMAGDMPLILTSSVLIH